MWDGLHYKCKNCGEVYSEAVARCPCCQGVCIPVNLPTASRCRIRDDLYDDIMRIDWSRAIDILTDAMSLVGSKLSNRDQAFIAVMKTPEMWEEKFELARSWDLQNPYLQLSAGVILYANPSCSDFSKARDLFELAAENGIAVAQYLLGRIYEYGQGVICDYEKAFTLFDKSFDFHMSKIATGHIYEFGLGQKDCDVGAASEWYEIDRYATTFPLYLRATYKYYAANPNRPQKFISEDSFDDRNAAENKPFSRLLSDGNGSRINASCGEGEIPTVTIPIRKPITSTSHTDVAKLHSLKPVTDPKIIARDNLFREAVERVFGKRK